MTDTQKDSGIQRETGQVDVFSSLKALTDSVQRVGIASIEIAERELSMAINISEQLRDGVFSEKALAEARSQKIPGRIRKDAHDVVDLLADVGTVLTINSVSFLEEFSERSGQIFGSDESK